MNIEKTKIIEAGKANYLTEIDGFTDLPSNCRFNKVLTGCGGTTVALTNDVPYVLCMPYVSLIKNKIEWCNERGVTALPVYGEASITDDEIACFDGNKIMVTYNSLNRVVDALHHRVKDYKILIDEYHLLVNSASFRNKAVNQVLNLYKEFGEHVFMTATPTKYLPSTLKLIPEVSIKWNDLSPVTLDYSVLDQKYLYPTVANLGHKFVKKEIEGNGYFFLNSVESIIEIIKHLNKLDVTHQDIRIVCADDKDKNNRNKLNNNLGKSYNISTVSDSPKKINFLTSTAFEGCDIYDEEGITYIISDGKKSHTKYDIMTTIPHIIGRIRNAKTENKNWAKVIFSPSEYFSYTTEEEFANFIFKNIERAKRIVKDFNNNCQDTKKILLEKAKSDSYLVDYNGNLEVNETAKCTELQYFNAIHKTYYVKRDKHGKLLQKEGSKAKKNNGIPYVYNSIPADNIMPDKLEAFELGTDKKCFKDFVEIYKNFGRLSILNETNEVKKKQIEKHYPLIPEAFQKLGYNKIKALGYHIQSIKAEIIKKETLSNPTNLTTMLPFYTYSVGRKVPRSTVKADIQRAYSTLGIDKTAKATDIMEIYEVKPDKIKKDGKWVHAYKIIGKK